MKDPNHPRWPDEGEKTQHEDVAEEWAWAYLRHFQRREHRRQTGHPGPVPTIADAGEAWVRHRERSQEANTADMSRVVLNHLYETFGRTKKLSYLTPPRMQRFFDERLDAGYKPSTLANYRWYLSAFFRYHGREGVLEGIELPDPGRGDPHVWSDAQLTEMREAADGLTRRHRLLIEVGTNAGPRRNELAALRWTDFREPSRTVRIERQVRRSGRATKPLKGKKARTVFVLPDWWEWHEPEGVYVLGGEKPLRANEVNDLMDDVLDAWGHNPMGVGVHSLRHTYARRFLEGGGSLEQLRIFLGHTHISTTEIYAHFGSEAAVRLATETFYG